MIYKIVILPVVLYGCESWSLTLREEQKLKAYECRVLRRIFRPKREEGTGDWRRLHNELHSVYYASSYIIRVMKLRSMKMNGACSTHGRGENCKQYFGWKF
jgi:hypothetical protein